MKNLSNLMKKILILVSLLIVLVALVWKSPATNMMVYGVKRVFNQEETQNISEEGGNTLVFDFTAVGNSDLTTVGAVDSALSLVLALSADGTYPVVSYYSSAGDVTYMRSLTYTLYRKADTDTGFETATTATASIMSNSTKTYNDTSSTDKKAPNAPTITGSSESGYKLNFDAVDNGSIYTYYYTTKTSGYGTTSVERTSAEVSQKVATGIAGYYYVVDTSPTNDFNVSTATYVTNNSISLDSSNSGKYIHVKAIDGAGNVSSVSNLQLSGDIVDDGNTGGDNEGNTGGDNIGDDTDSNTPSINTGVNEILNGVEFGKFSKWEDIEEGIAKVILKNHGTTFTEPMDVMLIVDESKSMVFTSGLAASVCSPCMNPEHLDSTGAHSGTVGGDGCQDKLYVTKETLTSFTTTFMGANPDNRVSLVTFNNVGTLRSDFSSDMTAVQSAINNITIDGSSLNTSAFFGETFYDVGFSKALTTLQARSADTIGRKTAVIFLTDGAPTSGHSDCSASINVMKDAGMEIYTIGLGINETDDASACNYLKSYCTDQTTHYAVTETSNGLDNIYENINNDIFNAGENATITDVIDENWVYYTDSTHVPSPTPASVNGQTVTWYQDSIDTDYTYTFYIRLNDNDAETYRDGTWDTNDSAKLSYTDISGNAQEISLANPNLTRKAVTIKYLDQNTHKALHTSGLAQYLEVGDTVTAQAITIEGYNLVSDATQSIEVTDGTNEIIFYYAQIANLSYTVNYYLQNTTTKVATSKIVNNQTFGESVTETAIDITGYNKVSPTSQTITIGTSENTINFYYTKKNDLIYKIEYYYNNVLDDDKTETIGNQTYGTVINTYIDKAGSGYKVDRVETLPMTIVEGKNVIRVYYVTDPNQTKELSYTVEYYKNGEIADTETEKVTVQVLESDTMTVDKSKINVVDKYYGYKVEEGTVIPNTVNSGEVIRINYVIDDSQTKTLSYSVEFYKDGILVPEDTLSFTKTVQVLEADVIKVDKENIKIENKYQGYYLSIIDVVTDEIATLAVWEAIVELPTEVNDGEVIKVYYNKRTDLSYRVEYYYNNVIDNEQTEVINNQTYGTTIDTYTDKVKVGYKLEKVENLPLVIGVNENVIKVYYIVDESQTKELSYTVEYYKDGELVEGDTEIEKTTVQVLESNVMTVNKAGINITNKYLGYKLADGVVIPDTVNSGTVIKVEYVLDETQTKDLSYTVKYYRGMIVADTVVETKTVHVLEPDILTVDKSKINLVNKFPGYYYSYTEPDIIPDTINDGGIISIHYSIRTDLKYTVRYLEQGTNNEISSSKTIGFQTYAITVTEKAIDIEGYNKVSPTEQTITIGVNGNEINFYYTKRADLEYIVNYLEKDTNEVLADAKVVSSRTFNEVITEEAINIKGYNKVEPINQTITIKVTGNVINFYYEKRTDLEYTVNYLEITTNKQLSTVKVVNNQKFGDSITEQAIDIEGYDKVNPTEQTIVIDVTNNVINFYYMKRDDLTYVVNYLEKDSNKILADAKVISNQVYGTEITENAIDIVGYNKVAPTTKTITIGVSDNTINFYYEKRTDLSYTVNYLEKDTNKKIAEEKVVTGITYNETIIENAIDIHGYNKVNPETVTIVVGVNKNEINFYYKKRTDLGYTVNYLEEGTNISIADSKLVSGRTYGEEIIENAIDVKGYNKVEPTEQKVTIDVTGNVINFYYTKRTDLTYIVNYIEKDTNLILADAKIIEGNTYQDEITEYAIDINGYNKVEPVSQTIAIDVEIDNNIIDFYYTKRTDLSYRVEYYYNNVIDNEQTEVINNQTYGATVDTYEDKVKVGYKLEKVETLPMVIGVNENVVRVYYVTDDAQTKTLKYTVEYYKDGVKVDSDTQVETKEVQVLENDYIEVNASKINTNNKYEGYKYVGIETEGIDEDIPSVAGDIPDIANNNGIIKVYYVVDESQTKELSYTVEYFKDGILVDEDTQVEMLTVQILKPNTLTVNKDKINLVNKYEGYVLESTDPEVIPDTVNSGDTIKVNYVRRSDLSYTVKYLEEGTNVELAIEKVVNNQTFGESVTEQAIDVVGYNKVNPEETIVIAVSGNEITFYYTKRTDLSYRVEYYYNNVIDNEQTEVINNQTYGTTIDTYIDKVKVGYKLDKVETLPMVIGVNENIVRVYYVTDDAQTKELYYTVEYYKDGVKVEEDTETEKVTVQVLQPNTMTVNKDKINVVNKYEGYVLAGTEPENIPDTVVNGDTIKVNYVRRSDLSYTVKYLEEGTNVELAAEKTVNNMTFGISVTEQAIDIVGYNKVNAEETITIAVSGNEINFYYTKRTDLSYRVEYYYNNVIDNEQTEIIDNQTYGTVINTYDDKEKVGYKFERIENLPLVIGVNENVLKVYYVTDESQTKELSYTVEYYKDGILADTDIEKTTVQVLEQDTMTVDKTKINLVDKYFGYKTENVVIPDTVTNGDVIRVDYVIDDSKTKDLSYTVEYYKDGILADTDIEKITVQVLQPNTITVNKDIINVVDKYEGYVLESTNPETIPDTVNSGDTIKVNYVRRSDLSYTVKYLEDGTNVELAAEKVVNNQTFGESVTEYAIDIEGYNKVNTEKTITIEVSGNEINFYYTKRTDLSYRVEYYYNNVIDGSATEVINNQTYGTVINTYDDKEKVGYKFERIENLPLVIGVNENVVRVYYVTDDTQTKELSYTVEYYKDGEIADTETEKVNVQVLQPNTMNVNKDKINVTDKYFGYRLEKTEPGNIPDVVNSGDTIKVFYVVDDGNTKTLSYTVEYYKDGVLADTDVETKTVQVLEPDTMTVVKDKINLVNKYEGYVLESTNPETIPDTVNSGDTIKVNYIRRSDLSYTVKYLEEGTNVELATEKVVNNQTFGESVTEQAIEIEGYNKVNAEETIVIAVSGNEINFYYAKRTDLTYIVNYIEKDTDLVLADAKIIDGNMYQAEITEQAIDIEGYNKVEPVSQTIVIDVEIENNVINFYYTKRTDLSYRVEYYYNNVIDNEQTEVRNNQTYGTVINTYDDKEKVGYKFERIENLPLVIGVNENVLRVYYVTDEAQTKELSYTVEYYKDGKVVDTEVEKVTVQVLESNTMTVNKAKINVTDKYFGYRFEKTEPDTIPDVVNSGDIIKIFYVIDDENTKTLSYTVEYYKDGTLADTEVESITVQILEPDTMNVAKDKINLVNKYEGYVLEGTEPENIPDTVNSGDTIKVNYVRRSDLSYTVKYLEEGTNVELATEKVVNNQTFGESVTEQAIDIAGYNKVNAEETIVIAINGNEINFYYTKRTDLSYRVEYYYNNVIDNEQTEIINNQTFGTTIDTYEDKAKVGYKLEKVETLPMVIGVNENVVRVYYVTDETQTKELSYTVEYYKDGEIADTDVETITVQVLEQDTMTVNKYKINIVNAYEGYVLEGTEPENIPDTVNSGAVIKVNYVRRSDLSYTVKYLEEGTNVELAAERIVNNMTFGTSVTEQAIDVVGYNKVNPEETIVIAVSGNEITFYYTKRTDLSYRVEYYYNNVIDNEQTEKINNQTYGATVDTYEDKVKAGYKLEKVETLPMVIGVNENVVRVYYVTDDSQIKELSYTVEYYKDGVLADTDVETKTVQVLEPDTMTVNKDKINIVDAYEGYVLEGTEPENIPDTVNSGAVIKVNYIRRSDLSYTVKYLEEGTNVELAIEKVVNNLTFGESVTEQAIDVVGYNKVNPEETIVIAVSGNEIKFYYTKRTDLSYRVEYYYNNVIDNEQTEVINNQTYGTVINTYDDKEKVGYKFERIENLPLEIGVNENVVRVYYVTDEAQTKELSYTVEYYKDGEIADTETEKVTVQALQPNTMTVNKDKINVTDKYLGYRLEKTEPSTIPDVVNSGDTIKVFYVIDDGNTKILSYTVEYYKDGVLADTEVETKTVQILEPDTMTVNKNAINIVDKYYGYKVVEGTVIPDTVNSGEVIRIDYEIDPEQTKELSYTVEYYKDGEIADTDVETITVQVLEPDTMTVNKDKINIVDAYEGYVLEGTEPENIPDTVNSGAVIKVNYVRRSDLGYTVKYLEEGTNVELSTEKVVDNMTFGESITEQAIDIVGYNKVNPEETITIAVSGNEIKFYYTKRTDLSYRVEYYYNNVIDNEQTEVINNQTYGATIDTYIDKVKVGYKLEKVETLPMVIGVNENVVRVYYVTDDVQTKELSYTVEYYKDGEITDTEVEKVTVQVLQPNTMTVNKDKINVVNKYEGYVLENTEPETIPDTINSGDTIKVNYVRRSDLSYTVKYLEEGTNVELATEKVVNNLTFGTSVTEQAIEIVGYNKVNAEETITIAVSGNEINFYYTKRNDLSYRVEYYYNNVIDNEATEVIDNQTFGTTIDTYEDKEKVGYKLEKVETLPMVIGVNENVVRVYYVTDDVQTKELSYTVEYYKDGVLADTEVEKITVQILAPNTMTVDKDKINLVDKYLGYKTENVVIPDIVNSGDVIRVDYVLDDDQTKELSYTVEYYKDGEVVETETEKVTVQILEPDIMTVAKDKINVVDKYEGYVLAGTEPENIPDTVNNGAVIKVNYVRRSDLSYTVKYLEEGTNVELATEKVVNNQTFGESVIEQAIDIAGYNKVNAEETIVIAVSGNEITFYYTKRTDLSYRIEYYYNNVIDNEQTEVIDNQIFGNVVNTYTDKVKVGYKLEKVETLPMVIGVNENVVRVYYVTDDAQTKELSYTVEYYKDGEVVDTEVEKVTVQVLEPNIVTVNKDKINVTDKYLGYRLEKTEPNIIPDVVNSGDVIKVYYVIDDGNTKTLNYTVEYYKDGVLADTEVETKTVQILEPDTMTVNKDTINIVDKYYGYKVVEGTVIPDIVNSGEVIRIDYEIDPEQTKELSYTVEYYKDGVIADTDVETITVQVLEPDTMTVNKDNINVTNKYEGYIFESIAPENIPDKVVNGTIIKVNYSIRIDLTYTINYYEKETNTKILESDIIENLTFGETVIENAIEIDGYDKVEPITQTIIIKETGNEINFYYTKRTDLSYTVKYLEEGTNVELSTEKVVDNKTFGDSVTEQAIDIEGYNKVNAEETITIAVSGNEINFYYTKRNDLSYRVEYYYNNVIDNEATEVINNQIYGAIVDTYEDKEKVGYKLEKVETLPMVIGVNENVVRVYYVTDDTQTKELSYIVEYYKDGVLADTDVETKIVQILESDIMTVNKEAINIVDKYYGYKLSEETVIPNEVTTGSVISVYYVTDGAQTKELSYTVEYYKDGTLTDTDVETMTVQVLEPDTLTVDKDKINVTNKYLGYRLEKTEPSTIPDIVNSGDVIKIYYVIDDENTKTLSYTVEYYKAGVLAETEVETKTVQILEPDTMTVDKSVINIVDKYYGYKVAEGTVVPDTVNSGDVIRIDYIIDESQTKELSYTVEYYKDGEVTDTDIEKITVQVLEPDTITVNKDKINVVDAYEGYVLERTEPKVIPDTVVNGTTIKVNYVRRTDLSYRVEYYYNNVIDNEQTEIINNQTFGTTIDTYEDKVKVGYKLEKVETLPMVIGVNENVVRVYYVTDGAQTKELSYTIEYYKNGELADTEIEKVTVQVLEPNTMTVNKAKINVTDKYFGYRFEKTEPDTIPDVVNSGDTIKVFYVVDDGNTKTLSYTVEYYKDGVLADTEVETKTVQILELDTMNVAKDKINVVNKYEGYVLEGTEPENIPDTVNSGDVIKVNYVRRSDLSYTVKYLEDGTNVELADEKVVNNLTFGESVTEQAIDVVGYNKVNPEETITIAVSGNEINFYYTKRTDLSYRVEYYYNNVIDNEQTEVINNQTFGTTIDTYEDKVKVGYKLEKVETLPMVIGVNENVVRVYYVTDDAQIKELSYTVEYYKDGEVVDTETEKVTVQALEPNTITVNKDKINVTDKYLGYRLEKTEPDTIPDVVNSGDVIKVYYVIDDGNTKTLSYTVEYYKDGVLAETEVETTTVQILEPDTMTVNKNAINIVDKYYGYKVVEGTVIPDTVNSGEVIRIDYEIDPGQTKELSYTVEYYKDGEVVDTEVEKVTVQVLEPDTMTVNKDKINIVDAYEGYVLEGTEPENIPDTVNSGAVIKVNYVRRNDLSYTVKYLEEGTNVELASEKVVNNLTFGTPVTEQAIDIVGYNKVNAEETIMIAVSGNEITFYYTKRTDLSYRVEYYYNNVIEDSATEIMDNQTFGNVVNTYEDKVKVGYKLEKVETLPMVIGVNENVVRVYYVTDDTQTKELSYTVEYYKDGEKVDTDTHVETITVQVLEPDIMTVDKTEINIVDKYYGYKVVEGTVVPDTVNSGEVIRIYYELDSAQTKELSYTVEYYKDGEKVDADTHVETITVQVLEPDIMTVNKGNINITDKYSGYVLESTDPEVIPDTVVNGAVIKVNYVRRSDFTYVVRYLEEGTNVELAVEKVVNNMTFGESVTEQAIDIEGYNKVNQEETIVIAVSGNEINFYYTKRTDLSYRVEYYYNDVIDNDLTEINDNQTFGTSIDTYIDKAKVGYKLDRVETIPMVIGVNENIIKVFYEVDIDNIKELSYTVEYYKDGEKVDADTHVETITVQVLEPDIMTVNKAEINIVDKYYGYKVAEGTVVPDTVNSGEVIRIYYELDSTQTKELSYTVEYYKDGEIADTEIEKVTVQVLELDTMTVDKDKINVTDKYLGYRLEKTEPDTIPDIVNSGDIIKVYYVLDDENTKELSYTVEYYKDGEIADTEVETVIVHILESDIITVNKAEINIVDKYYGYKVVEGTVIPDTVNSGDIIRIDYIKDSTITKELSYTVEYYKDGEIADTEVETVIVHVLDSDVVIVNKEKINIVDKYYGYKVVDGTVIPDTVNSGEVIRIDYIKDDIQTKELSYTVEYYKDGSLADTEIETVIVHVLDSDVVIVNKEKINIVDKYYGYKVVDGTVIPDTVNSGEIIRIDYIKDDTQTKELSYTVEYYKDNIKIESDTIVRRVTVQILDSNMITVDKSEINLVDKYVDCKLSHTVPRDIPDSVESGSVIKVYYISIPKLVIKYVDINTGNEIQDEVVIKGDYGETYDITEYVKDIEGFTMIEKPELAGEFTNIVTEVEVGYARNTEVIIKYLDKENNEELILEEKIEGYVGKEYVSKPKDIENYTYVESINEFGRMTEEVITVTHYYLTNAKVIINHIDSDTGEVIITETFEGKVGDEYTSKPKDLDMYVLDQAPENETVILTKEDIVLEYYYSHVSNGVIEKHIDIMNDTVLNTVVYTGNVGDEYETSAKEFEQYDIVTNERYYKIKLEDYISDDEIENLIEEYQVQTKEELFEKYEEELLLKVLEENYKASDDVFVPDNYKGTMTIDVIEVKYYYVRKTNVKVQYINNETGELFTELNELGEEIDSTQIINGHEGDKYETLAKEFKGYKLIENKLPENAVGTMSDEEIIVKYYYEKAQKKTVEKHVDTVRDDLLNKEEYIGDEFIETNEKDFDGYIPATNKIYYEIKVKYDPEILEENGVKDVDELLEKLEINPDDTYKIEKECNEDTLIVQYYYIRRANVKVVYIDKITGKEIETTENIVGYEGKEYKTNEKVIEGYSIVKEMYPGNAIGEMAVAIDANGNINPETLVKYYYAEKAGGVVERHIDIDTNTTIKEERFDGNVGDTYTTTEDIIEGYKLVTEQYPSNKDGLMTKEEIIVNYYYKKEVVIPEEKPEEKPEEVKPEEDKPTEEIKPDEPEADRVIIADTTKPTNNKVNTNNTSNVIKNDKYDKDEVVITPATGDIIGKVICIALIIILVNIKLYFTKRNKKDNQ